MRVSSLSIDSAGAERLFKSRSGAHTKVRNKLLDGHADQQTSIILYNNELELFDAGMLATKRDSPIGLLFVAV